MESAKERLVSAAMDLFENHGVNQGDMFSWIREELQGCEAGREKMDVLYNVCHGGFSFSSKFVDFVDTDIDDDDPRDRIRAAPFIIPFAEHILAHESMHGLRDILQLYHIYNFHKIHNSINEIVTIKQGLLNVVEGSALLDAYLLESAKEHGMVKDAGGVRDMMTLLQWKRNFSKFSRRALLRVQEMYREGSLQRSLEEELENEMNKLVRGLLPTLLPTRQIEKLISFMSQTSNPQYAGDRVFVHALLRYGYKDVRTWRNQQTYDGRLVMFLMQHVSGSEGTLAIDRGIDREVLQTFGLLCAAGMSCRMAVCQVPSRMGWHIEEYDGAESIVID